MTNSRKYNHAKRSSSHSAAESSETVKTMAAYNVTEVVTNKEYNENGTPE